jgi:hypothetical protein
MIMGQRRRWRVNSLARWGILVLGLLPTLTACYPYDSNKSASDYDIAITQFDKQANFYPAQPPPSTTYFMPNQIDILPPNQTNPITIPPELETQILSQVAANLAARQYTRVFTKPTPPPDPQPNFIITVSATTSTYYGYTYWGYWWGYGCYCYGGYYPYMQPYSFTTGTILINMADTSREDTSTNPPTAPMVWGCAINGLINSGNATARVTDQINQCFNQSPYLGPS